MRPRIYLTGSLDPGFSYRVQEVATLLIRRGYAVHLPQVELLSYHSLPYQAWRANEREWMSCCAAYLKIEEVPDQETESIARDVGVPVFYSLDTLCACIRIAANVATANSIPISSRSIDTEHAPGMPAPKAASPSSAHDAATTAGTTAPTPRPGARSSVHGRYGGLPMVIKDVWYDGEEWQCSGCDQRYQTQAGIFHHVATHHHSLLKGENPC